MVAGNARPSLKMTVYSAFCSLTTCLFVRMSPFGATMNPDPPPVCTMPRSSTVPSGIVGLNPFGNCFCKILKFLRDRNRNDRRHDLLYDLNDALIIHGIILT